MLIEFSGPSASGKTSFVRHLLKKWPEAKSIRRSTRREASPTLLKAKLLAKTLPKFPQASWAAYNWHRRGLGTSSRPRLTSLRMGAEYCLLNGASQDGRLWLLDQGRLQLNSWLPREICENPVRLSEEMECFAFIGDGVVLIRPHPEIMFSRIVQRGDTHKAESLARKRGFSSVRDYCDWIFQYSNEKLVLAETAGRCVLLVDVGKNGRVATSPVKTQVRFLTRILNDISDEIKMWWRVL